MSRKKTKLQIVSRGPATTPRLAGSERNRATVTRMPAPPQGSRHPQVAGRWLLTALGLSIAAAALCGWAVLCLLFWQGGWQLLYHPSAKIARTPANAGIAFDPVAFAATDAGMPRLAGWWIPAEPQSPYRHFTFLYLHSRNGNLGDAVDTLARLHAVGVNVLAFDYRGYGQSQFVRPSEANWRQDADWALAYLTATRHIDARAIVLVGEGLGANLAFEVAAAHPELAGVVLDSPINNPMNAIFNDPRARMVPAHLLVRDRYALNKAAAALRIPLLWFEPAVQTDRGGSNEVLPAYQKVATQKMMVWLNTSSDSGRQFNNALSRWLDGLPTR